MAEDQWDTDTRGERQAVVQRPDRTIWKYPVPILERFTLELPGGAEIIRFENEDGFLWLWAVVEPAQPLQPRDFAAVKTGAPMPRGAGALLGRAALYIQAELMLYFFEVVEPPTEEEEPVYDLEEMRID